MNPDGKNLVCLYSEPNFLAVNILENLLANSCLVNIVSDEKEIWLNKTLHIATKSRFNIGALDSFPKDINYKYVIFSSGFLKKENTEGDFKKFLRFTNLQFAKTFVIFPKEVYRSLNINQSDIPDNAGIIYLGDLLGPRIDLESDLKMPLHLNEIIAERSLTVPVGEVFYPVLTSDAAKQIVIWLFAFGPFGKETLFLGPQVSSTAFWQINTKLVGEIKYITDAEKGIDRLPKNVDSFRVDRDVKYLLTETYRWISSHQSVITFSKKNKTVGKRKEKLQKSPPKKFKKILKPLLAVLLFPILTLIVSGGLTYFSFYQFQSGRDNLVMHLLSASKTIARAGYFESRILKYIPIVGQVYKETEYLSYGVISASDLGKDVVPLARKASQLLANIFGDDPYQVTNVLAGSEGKLQQVYDNVLDLEKNTIESKNRGSLTANMVLSKTNFENYKHLIYQLTLMVERIPNILGVDKSKTYLVLFENNMELRPTGGFIGSFGLLKFDSGRLSEVTISDVYSADGQLNGHVEPPAPIKEHLGEANWWLRDSNWDPDFPTSAKRAEWFLDKEISQSVDGVASIDLNPVKDFLKISRDIYLSDYSLNITPDNLYEKVQSEVEDNFFPGTHKKASFLTTLSRNIITEVEELTSSEKLQFLKLVYENLNERHIQVFLHDGDFQKSMSTLGWDGSVFVPICEDECSPDLIGIVEANVGVNKSNYFIKRNVNININIDAGVVEKSLTLSLENSANTSLGLSGRYKPYVRLLIPENSTNIKVISSYGRNTEVLTPDLTSSRGYKEVGIITEVLAGETKELTFNWMVGFDKPVSQYNLFFRKQAGVDEYPVNITVNTPIRVLNSSPAFSLTKQGNYVYNATLARDLLVRLSL